MRRHMNTLYTATMHSQRHRTEDGKPVHRLLKRDNRKPLPSLVLELSLLVIIAYVKLEKISVIFCLRSFAHDGLQKDQVFRTKLFSFF